MSLEDRIYTFFSQFTRQIHPAGTTLLHPQDTPPGIIYLKKGFVREFGISPAGVEVPIHILAPGSFFPMTWGLNDTPNRYYFETISEVEVHTAPRGKTVELMKSEPEILLSFTKRILSGLDKLTGRIELMAFGRARARVISILLYLARHFGEKDGQKVVIKQKFTHRDIASFAAMTRETTSREWEKLQREGHISHTNGDIVLSHLEILAQELDLQS